VIEWWDWKKKSKFYKIAKQEIRNQKNNDKNKNSYKLEDNSKVLHGQREFQEDEKKKRERKCRRQQTILLLTHTLPQKKKDITTLPMTRWKGILAAMNLCMHYLKSADTSHVPTTFCFFILYIYSNIKLTFS
jgi:hypothetical protein